MKKKILFGLGAFALAAVLTLNVSLTKNETNSGLSLNSIETVAQAEAECCSECGLCIQDCLSLCDWCDYKTYGRWA